MGGAGSWTAQGKSTGHRTHQLWVGQTRSAHSMDLEKARVAESRTEAPESVVRVKLSKGTWQGRTYWGPNSEGNGKSLMSELEI